MRGRIKIWPIGAENDEYKYEFTFDPKPELEFEIRNSNFDIRTPNLEIR